MSGTAENHPLGVAIYPVAICALIDMWLHLEKGIRLRPVTGNELCHDAMGIVASVLDVWPESFFKFCDRYERAALQSWQRVCLSGGRWTVSEMPGWLLVARALEEYLEDRSPGPGNEILLKRFLSREETGQRLGLGVNQVDRLVERGRLRSVAGIAERSTTWIDSCSLTSLIYDIKRALPIDEAAADLGIGVAQIKDLADYGLPAQEPASKTDGYGVAKFSRKH